MTTTHIAPEQTPKAIEAGQHQPPTYAESVASETSYVQVPNAKYQPSPLSRAESFRPETQQQQQVTEKKRPGRFNQHFHSISSKVGWPLNKAANIIGAEGWWPTSMERECNKAARILHSFTSMPLILLVATPRRINTNTF